MNNKKEKKMVEEEEEEISESHELEKIVYVAA